MKTIISSLRKHIITTAIEHKAVLEPIGILESNGFDVTYISPGASGRIDSDKLLSQVRDDTLLISVMHVNNETGIIQPVDIIGEELSQRDVLFHIDAAQSLGKLVDGLKNIKYDLLSASAHKMYGPQGIGTLILRKKRYKLPPVSSIMYGGSQEHGIRPGTVPTALIAGFGKACDIAEIENGRYILSGELDDRAYIQYCYYDESGIHTLARTQKNITVTDAMTANSTRLIITAGAVFNNETIYPMLRCADITDDTYEPYKPSVEERLAALEAAIMGGET